MHDPDHVEIEPARSLDPWDEGAWMVRVQYLDAEGLPERTAWLTPDDARAMARMLVGMFSRHRDGKTRARRLAKRLNEAADRVERLRSMDPPRP
jgi:hypothetical protein